MLEFMNKSSVNEYNLSARFRDCEPSLPLFNYITPLAVCVEAMIKIACLENPNKPSADVIEEETLDILLKREKYTKWLADKYDIKKDLIYEINLLRKETNTFKHSLSNIQSRNNNQKKIKFKCFYEFTAKYYKAKTGEDAPPWSDDAFYKLMEQENKKINHRADIILGNGGKN